MGKMLNSKYMKFCCVCDSANEEFSDLLYRRSSFEVEMLLVNLNVSFGNQRNCPFISAMQSMLVVPHGWH